MKRFIGSYVVVFIVIGLIAAGGLLSQQYLNRTSAQLVVELKEVKKLVEQDDWKGSKEAYDRFDRRWTGVRKNWAMFTDHFEIDNIEMRLARSREFIEAEDAVNASAEFGEAIMLLEHIPERGRLTLHNIF